jgi:hypothetical protein
MLVDMLRWILHLPCNFVVVQVDLLISVLHAGNSLLVVLFTIAPTMICIV